MLPTLLHPESLTVHIPTPGAPDTDGIPAVGQADLVLTGCSIQGASSDLEIGQGQESTQLYEVSAPGIGHGIPDGARVTWRLSSEADIWHITGTPLEFAGTGLLDHTEFTITSHRG